MLVLERLSDARRNGHPVLAVMRGSRGQPGRRVQRPHRAQRPLPAAGHPAGAGQRPARRAGDRRGRGARHRHPLGDPIEAQALLATYGQDRPADRPLWLGSLKSNIGHTQAAAGVGGVIKMVQALRHGRAAPHPARRRAHRASRLVAGHRASCSPSRSHWPQTGRAAPRRRSPPSASAAPTRTSILEEAPAGRGATSSRPPRRCCRGCCPGTPTGPCAPRPTAAVAPGRARRPTSPRWVVPWPAGPGSTTGRWCSAATAAAAAPGSPRWPPASRPGRGHRHRRRRRSGRVRLPRPGRAVGRHGRRAAGRLAGLRRADARAAPPSCAPYVDWALLDVVRGVPGAPALDRVDVVQPALWAMMVSLAATWRAYGVEPDAVVGHSQGEIAAACVAGALSLDDGARVVALRSRAIGEKLAGRGGMVSVGLPADRAQERIARWAGDSPSPRSTAPARWWSPATPEALRELVAALTEERGPGQAGRRRLRLALRAGGGAGTPAAGGPGPDQPPDRRRSGALHGHRRLGRHRRVSTPATGTTTCARRSGSTRRSALSPGRAGPGSWRSARTRCSAWGCRRRWSRPTAAAVVTGTLRRDDGGLDRLLTSLAELHVRGVGGGLGRRSARHPPGRPAHLRLPAPALLARADRRRPGRRRHRRRVLGRGGTRRPRRRSPTASAWTPPLVGEVLPGLTSWRSRQTRRRHRGRLAVPGGLAAGRRCPPVARSPASGGWSPRRRWPATTGCRVDRRRPGRAGAPRWSPSPAPTTPAGRPPPGCSPCSPSTTAPTRWASACPPASPPPSRWCRRSPPPTSPAGCGASPPAAWASTGSSRSPSPAQGALWGLGPVLALDYPGWWGGLVDLPAEWTPADRRPAGRRADRRRRGPGRAAPGRRAGPPAGPPAGDRGTRAALATRRAPSWSPAAPAGSAGTSPTGSPPGRRARGAGQPARPGRARRRRTDRTGMPGVRGGRLRRGRPGRGGRAPGRRSATTLTAVVHAAGTLHPEVPLGDDQPSTTSPTCAGPRCSARCTSTSCSPTGRWTPSCCSPRSRRSGAAPGRPATPTANAYLDALAAAAAGPGRGRHLGRLGQLGWRRRDGRRRGRRAPRPARRRRDGPPARRRRARAGPRPRRESPRRRRHRLGPVRARSSPCPGPGRCSPSCPRPHRRPPRRPTRRRPRRSPTGSPRCPRPNSGPCCSTRSAPTSPPSSATATPTRSSRSAPSRNSAWTR